MKYQISAPNLAIRIHGGGYATWHRYVGLQPNDQINASRMANADDGFAIGFRLMRSAPFKEN